MRLLLVEDNPTDAMLFKDYLTEHIKTSEIIWVTDGAKALDYLYQKDEHAGAERPDLILLDLSMPRIDGYDVLKEVKTNPPLSDIPVVVFTTSCSPLDQKQCEILGAEIFLSKPSSIKEYEPVVKKIISMQLPKQRRATG
jgi:CheY-like chemotaxis protein